MIVGIGVDIVDISRVEEKISKKVLTEAEIEQMERMKPQRRKEYIAGRFALKEAFFKALGTGINGHSFKSVEFLSLESGRPVMKILKDFYPVFNYAHVSLSHDKLLVAVVILERRRGGVFVKGECDGFEIVSKSGEILEIETDLPPYELLRVLRERGCELLRYGNILEVE